MTQVSWTSALKRLFSLRSAPLLAALLGAGFAQHSLAEVHYRWIDERGHPVHSDRPPPGNIDYEVVAPGAGTKRSVQAGRGAVPADLEPKVGNEFEPAPVVEKPIPKNPEYCQRAQDNLWRYENAARVRLRNDQGEVYYVGPEEREARRQDALKAIDVYCE